MPDILPAYQSPQSVPTQTQQPLTSYPSSPQSSPKSPKKLLLALMTILLIILILGGYFLYRKWVIKNISINQTILEQKDENTVDILSLSGWLNSSSITRLSDGRLQITTPANGTEILVPNRDEFVEIGNSGFEVLFKARAEPKVATKNYLVNGNLVLYNGYNEERLIDDVRIYIGIDNSGLLTVYYIDKTQSDPLNRRKAVIAETQNIKLSSNELKIEVIGSGPEEKWNLYDLKNGQLLAQDIKMPAPFLVNGSNKIYFGLYPQSVSSDGATMTVEYLKLRKK